MTITLQVGNTDDRLTQKEWAGFVHEIGQVLDALQAAGGIGLHFGGAPPNYAPWQNYCWVFEVQAQEGGSDKSIATIVKEAVRLIRETYKQESVAWTEGETEFL